MEIKLKPPIPRLILLFLLALAFLAAPVQAQVFGGTFYSSFGPNAGGTFPPSAYSINFWCISGSASTGCGPALLRQIAAPFKATVTAAMQSVTLPLAYGGSGTNGVIVSLAADSSGTPGNVLESWTVTGLPTASQPALTSLNDRLNLTLAANQGYWLIVQPLAADTYALWYTNVLGLGGAMTNNGAGWSMLTGIVATQPAFSIGMSRLGSLSHIAANGGWTTVITLVNTASVQNQLIVSFYADDGSPLNLLVSTTLQGNTQSSTTQQISQTLNPNTTMQITMGGLAGNTVVGSAQIYSSAPLGGYAIFRQTPLAGGQASEGTVPLSTQSAYSLSLPYDNTTGFVMGVALANLSPTQTTVNVQISDVNGVSLGAQNLQIAPNGHIAFVLPAEFPATNLQLGVMKFTANGAISGLGLRFSPFGTFTSVPTAIVAPLQ